MSRQCVVGKLKGEDRKAIIQGGQKQMQQAALGAIQPLLREFCEAEVTAKLGRGKGEARRVSGQAREIDWQCSYCGCRDANHFTGDGHYRAQARFCRLCGEPAPRSPVGLPPSSCKEDIPCFKNSCSGSQY